MTVLYRVNLSLIFLLAAFLFSCSAAKHNKTSVEQAMQHTKEIWFEVKDGYKHSTCQNMLSEAKDFF